jgi:gliding motility-associated-like protein
VASFNAPDTVCVGAPVQLQNTSTGANSHFWNFCSGNIYSSPEITNLGNPGGLLTDPVFTAFAKDGDDYYVFVINNTNDGLVRLAFGNSLLNTPVATRIDNLNIPPSAEGIQIVHNASGWYIIVVGGTVAQGSRIVTISFGASLANNSPVGTNWGNIGNLAFPVDLYVFEEGGNYYGFTCNFENNTLTRFDFGNDLDNPPTGINLGSFGGLINTPTGIFTVKENGRWYLMLTNERTNELLRMDFGTSLLNTTPVVQSLGNPGNALYHPRDISLIKECGQTMAVVVNGADPATQTGGSVARFDFHDGIAGGNITGSNLGNPNNLLDFPHGISTVFREGNELYSFIPNVRNRSLVRMAFKSCTNASIPSSTAANPPAFQYNQTGIYTVNLIINEGLPTQQSACRNIVVVEPPVVTVGPDLQICDGRTVTLDAGDGFRSYSWSNGSTDRTIDVDAAGTYAVSVSNGACTATDGMELSIYPVMQINADILQQIDCRHTTGEMQINIVGGTAPFAYELDGATGVPQNLFTDVTMGDHTITVTDDKGCTATDVFEMTEDVTRKLAATATVANPLCADSRDGTVSVQVTLGTAPFEYALANGSFQPQPDFTGLDEGTYKVYVRNSACIDSMEVQLTKPSPVLVSVTKTDEICYRSDGIVSLAPSGGIAPYSVTWENNVSTSTTFPDLSAGTYHFAVTDAQGCTVDEEVEIENLLYSNIRIRNSDMTINIGEQVVLEAENAQDYHWEPVDGSLSCIDCATTIARPLKETQYIVRTSGGQNCISSDTVLIRVTYFRSFFMPNAFSPNNDGHNDYFRPVSKGVMVFSMQLYNRWGELIFQTGDLNQGWDGKVNGVLQPVGTYVYVVNYGLFSDQGEINMQSRKGTFTLIR